MRSTYLICYDICDDKRLKKVFKTIRRRGDHLQYSIFECQLSPSELLALREELRAIINYAHDQVLFVNLGPSEGRGERVIETLGLPYSPIDLPCFVV